MAVNVADAKGLTFECRPGCGFCCTASPLVAPHEEARLAPLVVRAPDGNLRIPLAGVHCSALADDRRCGIYDARPSVCHLYP
ncbi:MAG TPA: YkgJ family cysteine cluster protein, partial [Candidatus Thermoplasmatota archaeon]|nr:YkgJ family cysteine cluster protein [Candidatus Thermoplasmatota archaeon]